MKLTAVTIAAVSAACVVVSVGVHAYSSYAKWTSLPVTFYVNPTNQDVTASAAAGAFQAALDVWNTQGGSPFRYFYGGTVSDTATAHDYRNVAIFRNVSNGGTIATTYSWWTTGGSLLDADIIFWDGGFKFYTGTSGCTTTTASMYIEDVATHELGHGLGLNHSSVSDATMYPTAMYCSQMNRTLASDDVSAIRALYGTTTAAAPVNTAPTVVITSPANGATFFSTATISLAATATDKEDGNLTSKIQWTDNGTVLGTGGALSKILSLVGVHTLVAKVTDSKGAQGSSTVNVTITLQAAATTQATLTVKSNGGSAAAGTARAYLYWSGVSGTQVDIYRNGVRKATAANIGVYKDYLPVSGSITYTYKVCAAGTQSCTNQASVSF
jgi:hypothetical protein